MSSRQICNSPHESLIYLQQKLLWKNHENRWSFCPQKFLPKHPYVNVSFTFSIRFHCCFDVITLNLSTQNIESMKANVMSSFILVISNLHVNNPEIDRFVCCSVCCWYSVVRWIVTWRITVTIKCNFRYMTRRFNFLYLF